MGQVAEELVLEAIRFAQIGEGPVLNGNRCKVCELYDDGLVVGVEITGVLADQLESPKVLTIWPTQGCGEIHSSEGTPGRRPHPSPRSRTRAPTRLAHE